QVDVVVPRERVIVADGGGPLGIVGVENLASHVEPGDARGNVVGTTTDEPAVAFGQRLERLPAFDEVVVGVGKLPDAVCPPTVVERIRHAGGLRVGTHEIV